MHELEANISGSSLSDFFKGYLSVTHHTMYGGTLIIVQIFDIRFFADLHVLEPEESKKYKVRMVFKCQLVC